MWLCLLFVLWVQHQHVLQDGNNFALVSRHTALADAVSARSHIPGRTACTQCDCYIAYMQAARGLEQVLLPCCPDILQFWVLSSEFRMATGWVLAGHLLRWGEGSLPLFREGCTTCVWGEGAPPLFFRHSRCSTRLATGTE
jgi:hypothetical protein